MNYNLVPWQFRDKFFNGRIHIYSRNMKIAEVLGFGRMGKWKDRDAVANAARIVACVNACEGINPEAVPDLLVACKLLADCSVYAASRVLAAQKLAEAAIAKAEKE